MGKQLGLELAEPERVRTWGGKREGAGRKATRPGTWAEHGRRPWHDRAHPVHVTLRVRRGVPNLRGYRVVRSLIKGLRRASTSEWKRQVMRRRTFRVVHFSIQPNHIHLIVEATSKGALARGMQGLASGLARRVNRTLGRRGAIFSDRYHGHAMSSPTEVRNAIVYVLKNYEKHPVVGADRRTVPQRGIDPCSSAMWFAGWVDAEPEPAGPPPVAGPRTWLLDVGWRRGGLVQRQERPAVRPGAGRGG
jgi:putative transposase